MTQHALDFTPLTTPYAMHEAELAAERDRLATSKARILARLRQGPATNAELNIICFRYGARIMELRREGHDIDKAHDHDGVWVYRLVGQP